MWSFVTEIAYYGAISLLVSVSLYYPVKQLAKKFNLMDLPDARKIHKKPTPRIGGVMIFVSFLLVYLIARKHSIVMPTTGFSKIWILVALCGSFLLGLADDVKNIRAYKKLFFQMLIGFIVAYAGLRIQSITVLSYKLDLGIFSYLITALWVTALLNAVNLIDGMDGLASGILIIVMGFTFVIGIIESNYFASLVSGILLGSLLGFYIFNFPPAKIFMGDSGSYFLGCMYAIVSLLGMKKTSMAIMMAIPLVLLFLPIADITYITFRRMKRKESVFKADKNHIHHRLLSLGLSVKQIIFLTYLVCISFGLIGILIALSGGKYGLIFFFLIMCLVMAGFGVIRILEKR